MGKKDREKMAKERATLRRRAARRVNGIAEETANAIFDFLEKFRGLRLQQIPLRRLRLDHLSDRLPEGELSRRVHGGTPDPRRIHHGSDFRSDCRCSRMGIKILAPDVNLSSLHFLPEKSGQGIAIRFGLASIKNVGAGGDAVR